MDKPKLQEQQLSKGRAVTSVENPDLKLFNGSQRVSPLHDGNTNTVMLDQMSNEMYVSQLPSIDQNKADKQQFNATLGKFNMSPTNTHQLNDLSNLKDNEDTDRKQNDDINYQNGSPKQNFRQTQDEDWQLAVKPTSSNLNGLTQGFDKTDRSMIDRKMKEEPLGQTLTQNQLISPKQDDALQLSQAQSEGEFQSVEHNHESIDHQQSKESEHGYRLQSFKTRDLSKLEIKAIQLAMELDNMYATFHTKDKKTLRFTKKSFYIFGDTSRLRRLCVYTVTSKAFENFVTVMILLNSILLAVHDHADRENETEYNQKLLKFDHFFSYFFIGECILKNIAYGFVIGKDTYLSDSWNILDFFVVIISVFELVPGFKANSSLKGLRTARILRPLRSINTMPSMKKLIQALLTSLKNLINVILFLFFIFMLFGIFGINSFQGQLYNRCRDSDVPIYDDNGELYWPILYDVEVLCIPGENNICSEFTMSNGEPSICGHPQDYDLPLSSDKVSEQELIFYNIVNFDNLAVSMMTIFQILTMEGWTNMMYNFMDVNPSKVLVVIYFCIVILFGSFFVMNLILATIMDSFDQQQDDKLDLDIDDSLREQQESSPKTPSQKKNNPNFDIKVDATVSDRSHHKSDSKIMSASPLQSFLTQVKDNKPEVNPRKSSLTFQDIDHKQESTNQDQEIDKAMKDVNSKSPFEILDQLTGTQAEKQTEDKLASVKQSSELPDIHTKQFPEELKHSKTELEIDPPVKKLIKESQDKGKSHDQVKSLKASRCVRLMDYLFDDEEANQIPDRAHRNKLYYVFYKLSMSRIFSSLIFICIILNTFVLAMDRYPITPEEDQKLYVQNHVFSWIFTAEMVIKLIGLGFKGYIQDGFNIFDGTIVILNLMDLIIFGIMSLEGLSNASIALQSFRCVRLLRVVKLARSWTALQRIIVNTGKSIKDIANFSLLLFLFIFIFNLLGMELFAYKVRQNLDGEIIEVNDLSDVYLSESPRANFDTFFYGFMSIFIVIIGEDWNSVMYSHYRSLGPAVQIYFVVLLVFGNFILLSLFTAILLKNFENDTEAEQDAILKEKEKERKKAAHKKAIASTLSNMMQGVLQNNDDDHSVNLSHEEQQQAIKKRESKLSSLRSSKMAQSFGPNVSQKGFLQQFSGTNKSFTRKFNDNFSLTQFHQEGKSLKAQSSSITLLQGKSLYIFSPKNKLRRFLNAMIETKSFDNFILLLICLSTCFLALENPLTDPDGELMKFLQIADKIMTILFVLEMIVKVIALGFMFNGRNSYIKNGWNQLDFIIVIASIIIMVNNNPQLKFIKALRIFRVLRPLRMIQRQKGLKVAVISMINAIPDIINLQMIVLFVFFLMGILGTTFFKGKMNYCDTTEIYLEDTLDFIHLYGHADTHFSKWDCINSGGEWLRHELNFDNALYSVQTLFILQSTEGWVDMLWTGIDASEIDYIPIRDNQPSAFFFFMISIILFSLFFLNLFVGVVIDTFKREKDILSRNSELNVDQREWISIYTMILQSQPQLKFNKTGNRLIDACRAFVQHYLFDVVILICIILNTLVLAFTWYGESETITEITSSINTYFNIIFTLEAIIKIIGLKKYYFYDGWNVFDFVVVLGTWIILAYGSLMGTTNLSTQATLLRTFRIGRVFRVVKRFKDLKIIFNTLIEAIPSLASVGGLLMLLFFLYAIMGNFLFSTVMLNNSLGPHVNFQDFGTAFLLLFRMSTGESWFQIMFDYSRTYNHMYQCEDEVDFYSIKENGGNINGCGKPVAALIYFVSFQMIVSQIFLNLFIAIIIEAFGDQNEIESMSLQSEDIQCFQDSWKQFDPNATGFIKVEDYEPLILHICNQESNLIPIKPIILRYPKARRQLMIKMKNPSYFNFRKYSYYDTLKKLAEHKCELKFCIQKISTAKKCIYEKIEQTGGDIKENKFQRLLQLQLTKMVAVKESDDFDVFLNEINEADQEIEIVGKMSGARKKVYKKIGQHLDFKHGQIFDSQHQIMIPLIQKHIKKNLLKKKHVEEEGEFLSIKKNDQSSSATKEVLGITDSELITRTTSYQPQNDQKLLSQLSLARSSNTNNTQQIGQFKSSQQSSIQKGELNEYSQTHQNNSPHTRLSEKSHQANSNMLITENYTDSVKVGHGKIKTPMNQQGGIVSSQAENYNRLPTINSVKSGETEIVQNIPTNNNQKIDFKGDIIYEKQNEDSLLEELDDPDYHMISKDNSRKNILGNKQIEQPKNKIDFASIQKSKSSKMSNNFVDGEELEDTQSIDVSHFDTRKMSKDRQQHNESINHMIEDAGFDINGKQIEQAVNRNQNQKIGQKQVFLRQVTPLKTQTNQEKNNLDRIQEENTDQQETQIQHATGTQLRLESQILDDYQNADVAVIKRKSKRQLDTIDQIMINQSGELDSLDHVQKQKEQEQKVSNQHNKQVSLQNKFNKPQ